MNEEQMRAEFIEWFDTTNQVRSMEDWSWRVWQASIASQAKNVLPNQEPLGSEFEKVLYENLDSLYETDVVPQAPTDDERVRELEKDAERYHWLKDNYHGFAHYRSGVIPCVDLGQDIDRQIVSVKGAKQ